MLFNTDPLDIRKTFYAVWEKHQNNAPLEPLEQQILATMLEHPEHHHILDNPQVYLEREFAADAGETNPFLHFGLHLAIQDQIQLNQPIGIKNIFDTLCERLTPHAAMHEMMRELAYQIADMQRSQTNFDTEKYLTALRKL